LKISDLLPGQLALLLRHGNLLLNLAPFVARLQCDVPSVASHIALLYPDFECSDTASFADFHVQVLREPGFRRWYKPQARFYFDGQASFTPLPAEQGMAMIEWGLNWCVAAHAHQYLVIHAAVIEKKGVAVVMPAPPGSGKSTLCAGLVHRGWRLLSDELGLYDLRTGLMHGMARPVNLKNASIEVVGRFAPAAVFTPPVPDTTKGTVALMRPPTDSVLRRTEAVKVSCVVLPRYQRGSVACLEQYSRARTFHLLAEQSFNYDIQGVRGFEALTSLVSQSRCYQFTYSDLNEASASFDGLVQECLDV
jgi:HprK-related kinase A